MENNTLILCMIVLILFMLMSNRKRTEHLTKSNCYKCHHHLQNSMCNDITGITKDCKTHCKKVAYNKSPNIVKVCLSKCHTKDKKRCKRMKAECQNICAK